MSVPVQKGRPVSPLNSAPTDGKPHSNNPLTMSPVIRPLFAGSAVNLPSGSVPRTAVDDNNAAKASPTIFMTLSPDFPAPRFALLF